MTTKPKHGKDSTTKVQVVLDKRLTAALETFAEQNGLSHAEVLREGFVMYMWADLQRKEKGTVGSYDLPNGRFIEYFTPYRGPFSEGE